MKKSLFVAYAVAALAVSCAPQKTTETAAAAQKPITQNRCFLSVTGRDTFDVSLTMLPDGQVSGTLNYRFWEKDGAYGTIKGSMDGEDIVAEYDYTIEGSNQLEEVRFRLDGDKLLRQQGELIELEGGKLVLKDPQHAPYNEVFTEVSCK